MEAFREEKESQAAWPKCGEGAENTQGLNIPPLFLYWNMTPFLASYLLPFPQSDSKLPHTSVATEQRQSYEQLLKLWFSLGKKSALILKDFVFNLGAQTEVIKTPCTETRMVS